MTNQEKPRKRTTKSRNAARTAGNAERPPEPYGVGDPVAAALSIAALLASPYPEEAAAIDNVIHFVEDVRMGRPARVNREDLLLALSILLTATEQQLAAEARELLAMLDTLLCAPRRPSTRCEPPCPAHCERPRAPARPAARSASASCPSPFESSPSFTSHSRVAA